MAKSPHVVHAISRYSHACRCSRGGGLRGGCRGRLVVGEVQEHLGAECLGFIQFLEGSNVLPCDMREIVVERAMAAPGAPVALAEGAGH